MNDPTADGFRSPKAPSWSEDGMRPVAKVGRKRVDWCVMRCLAALALLPFTACSSPSREAGDLNREAPQVSADGGASVPDAKEPWNSPPDTTRDRAWTPSRTGTCSVDLNVSPSLRLAPQVLVHNGDRLAEPSVLFADETVTVVHREEPGPSSVDYRNPELVTALGSAPERLYDDGTHGDLVAGDGLFTHACLSLALALSDEENFRSTSNMWFLNTRYRGTETVTEVRPGVRSNETGYFISLGDAYALRGVHLTSLQAPNLCAACRVAWTEAGDVFDFFVVGTRDPMGGASFARSNHFITGTGFGASDGDPPTLADGRVHPELIGVVLMPWPGLQDLTHELGHGLIGLDTRDFPGPGDQAWNSGDNMHLDPDTTATGLLSGPFWDPARGWPHPVLLEDPQGI